MILWTTELLNNCFLNNEILNLFLLFKTIITILLCEMCFLHHCNIDGGLFAKKKSIYFFAEILSTEIHALDF